MEPPYEYPARGGAGMFAEAEELLKGGAGGSGDAGVVYGNRSPTQSSSSSFFSRGVLALGAGVGFLFILLYLNPVFISSDKTDRFAKRIPSMWKAGFLSLLLALVIFYFGGD